MIDPDTKLTIFHDDNGTFVDHSDEAADYSRDDFTVELVAADDFLYIGFRKDISGVYVQLTTPNTNASELSAEVYNGTSWVGHDITDETKGLTRSGFIFWDRPAQDAAEVNSVSLNWIRIKTDVDHSATAIRAINLVFSDDNLLKQEFYSIDHEQILPGNETSHILTHVSVRNRIMQKLRNLGYVKWRNGDPTRPRKYKLDQWDLLDVFEIRQAATYMALEKIFFEIADGPDDNWYQKYEDYKQLADEAFALALSSIDTDDDGVKDADENQAVHEAKRLIY